MLCLARAGATRAWRCSSRFVWQMWRLLVDELLAWIVISWTALIAVYVRQGYGKDCFHQTRERDRDCCPWPCPQGHLAVSTHKIHDEVASQYLLKEHLMIRGSLVDMYAKCGAFTEPKHGWGKEASVDKEGDANHNDVTGQGLFKKHGDLPEGAFANICAKCGSLTKAREVLYGCNQAGDGTAWLCTGSSGMFFTKCKAEANNNDVATHGLLEKNVDICVKSGAVISRSALILGYVQRG